jgi:undecaprenyl-diphosphatase
VSSLPKEDRPAIPDPKQAAAEVLAGQPGPAARRWLGATALVAFVLFAIDTALVASTSVLPIDISIATFIQQLNWGPIVYPMEFINGISGWVQVFVGVGAVVVLFLVDRRAGWLMAVGSISSLIDNALKLVISRQRPPADLVHILNPTTGFSYPSGHAVFFTWLSFMLATALAPHVSPRYRPVLWIAAAVVIVLTCLARVWAGVHWPSDVLGGFLLALGWSAFVLWLPERWMPSPRFKWFQARPRKA